MKWVLKWIYDDEHYINVFIIAEVKNNAFAAPDQKHYSVTYSYNDKMVQDIWSEEEIDYYMNKGIPTSLDMQRVLEFVFTIDHNILGEL